MTEPQKATAAEEAGELLDDIRDYVETRVEITRLTLLDKLSDVVSIVIAGLVIGFLFLLFFIFVGLASAYLIAEYTGHTYLGFCIVAIIFLTAGIIFIRKKKDWIQKPVADKIIFSFFKNDKDEINKD